MPQCLNEITFKSMETQSLLWHATLFLFNQNRFAPLYLSTTTILLMEIDFVMTMDS